MVSRRSGTVTKMAVTPFAMLSTAGSAEATGMSALSSPSGPGQVPARCASAALASTADWILQTLPSTKVVDGANAGVQASPVARSKRWQHS